MDSNQNHNDQETPALPKFSRYRSVRRAVMNEVNPVTPPLPVPQGKKLPSRYHRKQESSPQSPKSPTKIGSSLNVFDSHATTHRGIGDAQLTLGDGQSKNNDETRSYELNETTQTPTRGTVKNLPGGSGGTRRLQNRGSKGASAANQISTGDVTLQAAREEARMMLEGEIDHMDKIKKQQASQRRVFQAEASNSVHPRAQEQDFEHRIQVEKASKLQKRALQTEEHEDRDLVQDPDSTNQRLDRNFMIQGPKVVNTEETELYHKDHQAQRKGETELLRQESKWKGIDCEQDSLPRVNAGFDAPISAVNVGDRQVLIMRNETSVMLPVTPATTVKDILNSASVCLSEPINPRSAVLMECFLQLGLERPLRRYEKIRDVLNSWDDDSQNHLTIFTADEVNAVGLEPKDAPTSQPLEVSAQMFHSLKPHKWDKRWVKLREDGQVTISKYENYSKTSKIGHISDFDVYMPSRKQAQKLRPPKKICFAIKSQQKSAMFLNGTNFVHFFCSNDKAVADRWYEAVKTWRSWYLVHVLGAGENKAPITRPDINKSQRVSMAHSRDSIPHQLRSFKPLLEFENMSPAHNKEADSDPDVSDGKAHVLAGKPLLNFDTERRSLDVTEVNPRRGSRKQGLPPSSFPNRPGFESADHVSGERIETQPFTGSGLLARSASKRSQGGHASGKGVRGVAGKPLVDLSTRSEFADGSLLRQVEAWYLDNNAAEPKIDREKRYETTTLVGENV